MAASAELIACAPRSGGGGPKFSTICSDFDGDEACAPLAGRRWPFDEASIHGLARDPGYRRTGLGRWHFRRRRDQGPQRTLWRRHGRGPPFRRLATLGRFVLQGGVDQPYLSIGTFGDDGLSSCAVISERGLSTATLGVDGDDVAANSGFQASKVVLRQE